MTLQRVVSLVQRLAPDRLSNGFELHPDNMFRRWDERGEVCTVIAVIEYDRMWQGRYTVEIGFYSPEFGKLFDLPAKRYPIPADATMAGFFFRLESLTGRNETGWPISDETQEADVATSWREQLRDHVDEGLRGLGTLAGWSAYLRAKLSGENRRGRRSNDLRQLAWVLLRLDSSSHEECVEAIRDLKARAGRRFARHVLRLEQLERERFGGDRR